MVFSKFENASLKISGVICWSLPPSLLPTTSQWTKETAIASQHATDCSMHLHQGFCTRVFHYACCSADTVACTIIPSSYILKFYPCQCCPGGVRPHHPQSCGYITDTNMHGAVNLAPLLKANISPALHFILWRTFPFKHWHTTS